jgi:hypothetical protein
MKIQTHAFNMEPTFGIIIKMDGDLEVRATPSPDGVGFLMTIWHSPFQDIVKDSTK